MKAPDKVFVYCDHEGNPDKVDIYPLGKNSIEYIRKDALLEWAEAEIKLSKRVECVSEKSYEEGRQQVAQNLIDKLNSM